MPLQCGKEPSCDHWLSQEFLHQFPFLLYERNFAGAKIFTFVKVVVLVTEEDFDPLSSSQQNGFSILIDVGLQVQDGRGLVTLSRPLCHFERLLL